MGKKLKGIIKNLVSEIIEELTVVKRDPKISISTPMVNPLV